MLWIHGGGYMSSSNAMYTGHYLAAMDVVVVVINYRLGVFGGYTETSSCYVMRVMQCRHLILALNAWAAQT